MYIKGTLKDYLDDLAARKSAPGGGSAAAVVAALGTSLISMVANFTVGKEKYRKVEEDVKIILASSEKLRRELEKLIDEDVAVYRQVSSAYQLPKKSDAEKGARSCAIENALKAALVVPYEVCRASVAAAKLCPEILEKGNRNLVSDVGVAAEMLYCAYQAALLNVEINLSGIKDEAFVNEVRAELEPLSKEIARIREGVVKGTKEKI